MAQNITAESLSHPMPPRLQRVAETFTGEALSHPMPRTPAMGSPKHHKRSPQPPDAPHQQVARPDQKSGGVRKQRPPLFVRVNDEVNEEVRLMGELPRDVDDFPSSGRKLEISKRVARVVFLAEVVSA